MIRKDLKEMQVDKDEWHGEAVRSRSGWRAACIGWEWNIVLERKLLHRLWDRQLERWWYVKCAREPRKG